MATEAVWPLLEWPAYSELIRRSTMPEDKKPEEKGPPVKAGDEFKGAPEPDEEQKKREMRYHLEQEKEEQAKKAGAGAASAHSAPSDKEAGEPPQSLGKAAEQGEPAVRPRGGSGRSGAGPAPHKDWYRVNHTQISSMNPRGERVELREGDLVTTDHFSADTDIDRLLNLQPPALVPATYEDYEGAEPEIIEKERQALIQAARLKRTGGETVADLRAMRETGNEIKSPSG